MVFLQQLARKLEEVLIQTYLQQFFDEFDNLLRNDRDDDAGRLYSLVARLPDGLDNMKSIFENHVFHQGLSAIEKCQESADSVSGLTRLQLIACELYQFMPDSACPVPLGPYWSLIHCCNHCRILRFMLKHY